MTTPLTHQLMKEFVNVLGSEAKNCYYNLKETCPLKNNQVLDTYRDFYTNFETVPMLFLSLISRDKVNAVYLWQMNRKCPYQKGTNQLVLDSRASRLDLKPHPSLLLLAKITPHKGEQIVSTKLIGDNKLVVKFMSTETETMIFRLYKIKNFYPIAKVNPEKLTTLGNDKYSFELHLKIPNQGKTKQKMLNKDHTEESKIDENESVEEKIFIELELWKKLTLEEQNFDVTKKDQQNIIQDKTLIEEKIVEGSFSSFDLNEFSFSETIVDKALGRVYYLDKKTGSVLVWKEETFQLSFFPEIADFKAVYHQKDKLYIVNEKLMTVFELSLKNFPTIELKDVNSEFKPAPTTLENIVKQPNKLYDFLPDEKSPQLLFLNDSQICRAFLKNYSDSEQKPFLSLEDKFKKSKSFNWGICVGDGSSYALLVFLSNQFLYIFIIHFDEPESCSSHNKIVQLSQHLKEGKDYEIIGSSPGKIYLSRNHSHSQSLDLIEVNFDFNEGALFSSDYVPEIKEIQKTGQPFSREIGENFFSQIDEEKGVSFIRFENEPFYNDTVNLMYDVPITLVNPREATGNTQQKADDINSENIKEQEKKLLKKIAKTKVEISHSNKREEAVEESKEALKELRADISLRMKEVKDFDIEYQKLERMGNKEKGKDKDKEKVKVLKEPIGVSKESIRLYQDIKTEKKKLDKQRDKEKIQRKKDRAME